MRYIVSPILPDEQDREECLADVALLVWEQIQRYDPDRSAFTTWLTVLTRNTALNRARKRRETEPLSPDHPSSAPGPEEQVLRQELLDYIRREGLVSGPVFATSDGNPLPRSRVYTFVRSAGLAARVPEEKATPRGLWKMYLSTQEEIQSYVALLAEQRYCRMLEEEQQAVGWKV